MSLLHLFLGLWLLWWQVARRAGRLPALPRMAAIAKWLVRGLAAAAQRNHRAAGEPIFFTRWIADRHGAFDANRAIVVHGDFNHGQMLSLSCHLPSEFDFRRRTAADTNRLLRGVRRLLCVRRHRSLKRSLAENHRQFECGAI